MPTVTLGGITADLRPAPFMAALAIGDQVAARGQDVSTVLALGAMALRVCWPEGTKWPGTRRPTDWSLRTHPLDYASECYESLGPLDEVIRVVDEKGKPVLDEDGDPLIRRPLADALFIALRHATERTVSQEVVASAEGFTGASTEG